MAFSTLSLSSCNSVLKPPIADIIRDESPSWDGDQQNSGLLDYVPGKGYLITENAAGRYIWLSKLYSKDYSPPMAEGAGLSVEEGTGLIFLDAEHMVEFMVMSQKYKSSIKPQIPTEK